MLIAVMMMIAIPPPPGPPLAPTGTPQRVNSQETTTIAARLFAGVRIAMRDLLQPASAGQAVVAAEREQHPAGRRDRGQAAERHRDRDAGRQDVTELAEVVLEDLDDGDAATEVVLAYVAGVVERCREQRGQARQVGRQGEQEDEADDRRHGDRQEDAPRARDARAERLLGDVGRRVVAGVRPVRLEQREEEGEDDRVA